MIRNLRIFIDYYEYNYVKSFVERFNIKDGNIKIDDTDLNELRKECENREYESPDVDSRCD